jgi:uncharacterized BrkB/YihY/UPF0761 family membrane protein
VATFSVALWALVSGSRTLVKSLYAVHALIWSVARVKPRRSLLQGVLAIVLISALFVLVRLVAALADVSIALWIVAMALFVVVPGSLWLLLSATVFPSASGTAWRDMLPGAVLFGIGVQMLHVVTVVWISRSLESKSETYGALGAALTILLWAYLLGRLMTAAVSLNAVVWGGKSEGDTPHL